MTRFIACKIIDGYVLPLRTVAVLLPRSQPSKNCWPPQRPLPRQELKVIAVICSDKPPTSWRRIRHGPHVEQLNFDN
jgi:hypothetical protein